MNAARLLPSAERLGGSLLAIAALTMVALAVLVMFELDREAGLHRDLIAGPPGEGQPRVPAHRAE